MKKLSFILGLQFLYVSISFAGSQFQRKNCGELYEKRIEESKNYILTHDPSNFSNSLNLLQAGLGAYIAGLGIWGLNEHDSGGWAGGHDGRIITSTTMLTAGAIIVLTSFFQKNPEETVPYNKARTDLTELPRVQAIAKALGLNNGVYDMKFATNELQSLYTSTLDRYHSRTGNYFSMDDFKFLFELIYTQGYACQEKFFQVDDFKDMIYATFFKDPSFVSNYKKNYNLN